MIPIRHDRDPRRCPDVRARISTTSPRQFEIEGVLIAHPDIDFTGQLGASANQFCSSFSRRSYFRQLSATSGLICPVWRFHMRSGSPSAPRGLNTASNDRIWPPGTARRPSDKTNRTTAASRRCTGRWDGVCRWSRDTDCSERRYRPARSRENRPMGAVLQVPPNTSG